MREEGAFAAIRPLAGHLAEHAARLAAVIALIEDDAVPQLDERHLARGVDLARFYAAEALRISAIVPVMKTPAEITQQLQHWLERKQADRAVTLREICRSGPPSVRDADLAYRHMRRLERLGVVHQTAFVPETAGDTRRPGASQAWHVGQPTSPANSPCPSRGVARCRAEKCEFAWLSGRAARSAHSSIDSSCRPWPDVSRRSCPAAQAEGPRTQGPRTQGCLFSGFGKPKTPGFSRPGGRKNDREKQNSFLWITGAEAVTSRAPATIFLP
ncbi:MAG: DUF3987 domain-containing protein [Rhodospirillaceae bacterium]|nr:DUF3987 domain-containing protein [Rhodospirillaceae bacterium]